MTPSCDVYFNLIKVIKELKFTDSPFPNSLLNWGFIVKTYFFFNK